MQSEVRVHLAGVSGTLAIFLTLNKQNGLSIFCEMG